MADIGQTPDWCEALYRDRAAELILYGRALGLSQSEAEDVLHETFRALLLLKTAPADPPRYAVRSFRNRTLNHRRSLWRRVAREFESKRWFEPQPEETAAEHAAMRCLAQLPSAQREVIVLKVWHKYTFAEIAGLLDLSPNTVAGRYRYGIEKLRARLNRETDLEPHPDTTKSADSLLRAGDDCRPELPNKAGGALRESSQGSTVSGDVTMVEIKAASPLRSTAAVQDDQCCAAGCVGASSVLPWLLPSSSETPCAT